MMNEPVFEAERYHAALEKNLSERIAVTEHCHVLLDEIVLAMRQFYQTPIQGENRKIIERNHNLKRNKFAGYMRTKLGMKTNNHSDQWPDIMCQTLSCRDYKRDAHGRVKSFYNVSPAQVKAMQKMSFIVRKPSSKKYDSFYTTPLTWLISKLNLNRPATSSSIIRCYGKYGNTNPIECFMARLLTQTVISSRE
ncbi:hypothetical protein L4C54_19630 [Vibrio lamellibrachiae]|uniref:hypothetical protein n=1 Tax=Vibrio lamellibrachiae TaxID=2910253 RepID=UPI003D0978E9